MLYKFDIENHNFIEFKSKLNRKRIILGMILMLFSFLFGYFLNHKITPVEKQIIIVNYEKEKSEFTQDKLVSELKRLHIKFPYIVLAQSILETGHYTSVIFLENNNLFGMKYPNGRITTCTGVSNDHAVYDDWYQSMYDYSLYSCLYLKNINTEEEYYTYLKLYYAESSTYIETLQSIITNEKLKEKFL